MDNLSIGNTDRCYAARQSVFFFFFFCTHTINRRERNESTVTEPKFAVNVQVSVKQVDRCSSFFRSADFNVQIFTFDLVLCLWQYLCGGIQTETLFRTCLHCKQTHAHHICFVRFTEPLHIRRRNSRAIKIAM